MNVYTSSSFSEKNMKNISSKILEDYTEFQHTMLRKVLDGTVDPFKVMAVQRELIGNEGDPYLKLISGGQKVSISACHGGEGVNIYSNKNRVFDDVEILNSPIESFDIDLPQPATEKIDVCIYEMLGRDATIEVLFRSLMAENSDLKSLTFKSQEQICRFREENEEWLKDSDRTLFLFCEEVDGEEIFFVARIGSSGRNEDEFIIFVDPLTYLHLCNSDSRYYVVLPVV